MGEFAKDGELVRSINLCTVGRHYKTWLPMQTWRYVKEWEYPEGEGEAEQGESEESEWGIIGVVNHAWNHT